MDKMGQQESLLNKVTQTELHEVGAGGYGEVYTSEEYKEYAVKISRGFGCSSEIRKEFRIQQEVYENFHSEFNNDKILKYLDIVKVDEMGELENGKCAIVMERICPLNNPPVTELSGKTAHALVGDYDTRIKYHGKRGIFIGNQLLGNLISLPGLTEALGKFMAFMHFYLKLDANDLEFIIGSRCSSAKVMVFVLDFGMVEPMDEKMDVGMSLVGVPYFPIYCESDCEAELMIKGNLVKIFWDSYIKQAETYGDYGDKAREILEDQQ